MIDQVGRWFDDRLGVSRFARTSLNKIFPDHWTFMLGEIALYSFVVLLLTGVYLSFFFNPSTHEVIYHGSYLPLHGQKVSEAYASTVNLSFGVRGGLVMRQMHHWAANIFIAAIVAHMCRVFFTGAFRRPREMNWVLGIILLILAIVNGFIGYSLPDDLISGTGLRIAFSIVLSIPVVGSWAAFLLFGSNFPGDQIIPRFYMLHILVIPAIIVALIGAHLGLVFRQKHSQFPGPGRTQHNVVGTPIWPGFLAKTNGLFFMVMGGLAGLGGLAQINPIWLYGSYQAYKVSYAVQPDWYMGFLDGALRLMPSWETVAFGHMIPNAFFPAVLLPGLIFTPLLLWPWIEDFFTKESKTEHNLLDRPRDRPVRTAIGAGLFALTIVLFFASSTDVLANYFSISLNVILVAGRILLFVVPPVVGLVTYQICRELSGVSNAGRRKRANVVVRSADGGYSTVLSEPRPGDGVVELEPEELPDMIEFPDPSHAQGNGHGANGAGDEGDDGAGGDGSGGDGSGGDGSGGDGSGRRVTVGVGAGLATSSSTTVSPASGSGADPSPAYGGGGVSNEEDLGGNGQRFVGHVGVTTVGRPGDPLPKRPPRPRRPPRAPRPKLLATLKERVDKKLGH